MEMKPRKKKILEAIIKDYINTAEPVGSRALSKRYHLGVSPATIRNEMADLEDMGFLVSPHTSAGRIPTQKAYRYYVDEIMQIQKLAETMQRDIHKGYLDAAAEIDQTMTHTAQLLSDMTNYTSIVLSPRVSRFNCKHVQIIPLIRNRVMMVVVTNEGIARNTELTLSGEVDEATALKLSSVINGMMKNIVFQDITSAPVEAMQSLDDNEVKLLKDILPALREMLLQEASDVTAVGVTNLFNYPEFSDVDSIKNLVNVVQAKPLLAKILRENRDGNQILHVTIGDENGHEQMHEFSIMTSTYEAGGNVMGAFGVIGPTRMSYSKVGSLLEYIRQEINHNIAGLLSSSD